jgi:hypothetical protein
MVLCRIFTILDQRKQAKTQWLQDPNQSDVDNLKNLRREAYEHSRKRKKKYLRSKTDELENKSMIKNIRDMYWGIREIKND